MSKGSKRVLFIATVVKTHIMQFHVPVLKLFQDMGWETAVAARNDYNNPEDCQIPYCDHFYDIPFERNPFKPKNIDCYQTLKDIIDQGNFEIIHCHTPVGGVLGRLAARKARKEGTRVIYTAHGFHFYRGASLKNWLLYYPVEKFCSFFVDDLITINQEDYGLAKKKFTSANIHYLPGVGIDTAKFSPSVLSEEDRGAMRAALGIQPEQRMILSVGELIFGKNYKTAIDIIAKLKDFPIRYYICGQGGQRAELEEYVKAKGVEDRVIFLGYRRDIPKICACADVFLHTSHREGLPVAIMEAMACGTPVVASCIRGNTDLIEDGVNGFLCDSYDAAQFADSIQRILSTPDLGTMFRAQSLEKIKNYDVNIITEKMRQIYTQSV